MTAYFRSTKMPHFDHFPTLSPTPTTYHTPISHTDGIKDLTQSSIVQPSEPSKNENVPTDVEWCNVAHVLSTLRSQSLHATPAFTSRYAKQTTDTDIWAWKQTSDWENRKTIRRYLDRNDLHKAAAVNASFAAKFRNSVTKAREEIEESQGRRPSSAPIQRRNRKGRSNSKRFGAGRSKSRPQTAITENSRHRKVNDRRQRHPWQQQQQQQQQGKPKPSHRRTPPQTAGEWVIGLASGLSNHLSGKKYIISRRNKERFANVHHNEKLTLEKLAYKKRLKRINDEKAAENFARMNGMCQ